MDFTNQLIGNLFKALTHPTRIHILRLLEAGPLCVCDILPQLESEQSNTSQHLSVLKQSGFVESRREGTKVIYSVPDHQIYDILHQAEVMILKQLEETSRKLTSGKKRSDV